MLGLDSPFEIVLLVTNDSASAVAMAEPQPLVLGGTGSATLVTDATGGASLAPGASTSFTWTYRADATGTLTVAGRATADDGIESNVATGAATISEVVAVATDPLGDGSPFGYVTGYQGHVYIGPNETGTSLARVLPDGTGLETGLTFTFARDTTGNTTTNTSSAYTSIGYTGCTANVSCGPDNEDGRGFMAAGTLGGTEWLVLGGARSNADLDYIYMTSDTDTTLDFRYVDLDAYLGGNTHGFSAAHFLGARLYLGFPDSGGNRPYFIALQVAPPAPGLDAANADALDLDGNAFPGFSTARPARRCSAPRRPHRASRAPAVPASATRRARASSTHGR